MLLARRGYRVLIVDRMTFPSDMMSSHFIHAYGIARLARWEYRVDGAGHVRIFTKIMLPLMAPAIAAFGIFQFLWVWNNLLVALVFGGGNLEISPLTVRLAGSCPEPWQRLASPVGWCLRVHDRPADRVPQPAALLRPRTARGQRQGLGEGGAGMDQLGESATGCVHRRGPAALASGFR